MTPSGLFTAAARLLTRRKTEPPADPGQIRRALGAYAPVEAPTSALALQQPEGLVAADADGLLVHVGPGAPDFRRVPWDQVRHFAPQDRGGFVVSIRGVGQVVAVGSFAAELFRARARRLA